MKRGALLIFSVITLFNFVSASYISGDIHVYENGEASLNIETDIEMSLAGLEFANNRLRGTTEMLTKKERGIWTFFLNWQDYDTILIDIHLPKNLYSIESIKGIDNAIDIDNKIVSLIDEGNLDFEISYKLKRTTDSSWFFFIVILIIATLTLYLIMKKRTERDRLNHILPTINDNEKAIITLLMKKPLRQKELRKKLDIPKASFSRYMINLEKKKLILREGEGKNKIVQLK